MREGIIIESFKNIEARILKLMHYVQTGLTGATLFEETLKNLLITKGVFTESEFSEQMGKEIKKLQDMDAKKQEEEKKKLIKPSSEDTEKINNEKKKQEHVKEDDSLIKQQPEDKKE